MLKENLKLTKISIDKWRHNKAENTVKGKKLELQNLIQPQILFRITA